MKMVKSLLLGTAAGLVAMAGAQAADLPVKAKPVQYVKICSLYGVGFYYIPGTDTCIKIGGFVRTEWNFNAAGSFAPYISNAQNRTTDYVVNRSRWILSADVRSQTAYGTLRAYGRAGWQWTTNDFQWGGSQGASQVTPTSSRTGLMLGSSSSTYLDRAFIQLGGWTFGKTQSFYDFFPTGVYSLQTPWLITDSGGAGVPVFAYTFAFGNGLTATLSLEDNSEYKMPLVAVGATTTAVATSGTVTANPNLSITPGGTSVNSNAGNVWPNLVANMRVDQAWGSAQIMGALQNNRVAYYTTPANTMAHPSDELGFAIGGGLTINLPMIAAGDTFSVMMNYCEGAVKYCAGAGGQVGSGGFYGLRKNTTIGVAWLEDGYFDAITNGQLELSQAWNIAAGFNHKWNPQWQTSLYAMYLDYSANSATVNARSCVSGFGMAGGCRDFTAWEIGTRTMWNPVANLDIGVDVMYHKVNSAYTNAPGAVVTSTSPGLPAVATVGDVGAWAGILRFQRNFWP